MQEAHGVAAKPSAVRMAALGAAAILVVSYALVTPASAVPVRWATIRADRTATATVRLSRSVVLTLGEPGDRGPVVQISGGGKSAGFLLVPAHGGGESVGQIAINGTRYSAGAERVTVPAGTYLLRVLAESSPVVVRVPSSVALAWRATRPLRTARVDAVWDSSAGPLLLGGGGITLGQSSVVLFSLAYEATSTGENMAVCLSDRHGVCGPADGSWAAGSGIERVALREESGFAVFADRVARGTFVARWRVEARGVAASPAAFAYVIG